MKWPGSRRSGEISSAHSHLSFFGCLICPRHSHLRLRIHASPQAGGSLLSDLKWHATGVNRAAHGNTSGLTGNTEQKSEASDSPAADIGWPNFMVMVYDELSRYVSGPGRRLQRRANSSFREARMLAGREASHRQSECGDDAFVGTWPPQRPMAKSLDAASDYYSATLRLIWQFLWHRFQIR